MYDILSALSRSGCPLIRQISWRPASRPYHAHDLTCGVNSVNAVGLEVIVDPRYKLDLESNLGLNTPCRLGDIGVGP